MRIYRANRKALEAKTNPIINTPKKSVIIPVIDTNTKTPIMKQPRGLNIRSIKELIQSLLVLREIPHYNR